LPACQPITLAKMAISRRESEPVRLKAGLCSRCAYRVPKMYRPIAAVATASPGK
jgi:hypothetical protein